MKKLLMAIWINVLFLIVTQAGGMAASLDQLKNIIIDIQKPAVGFQFANFKVSPGPDSGSYTWALDLSINQSISNNTYIVKTLFQNKAGDTLFSGNDITLPAGNAGKTYSLTRRFQRDSNLSGMTFHIYNQVEDEIIVSRTYPLSTITSYAVQGATTSSRPGISRDVLDSSAKIDTNLDMAINFDANNVGQITIENNSSFGVNIDKISAKARFLIGMDQDIEVHCGSKQIQSGQALACSFSESYTTCPTLSSIDIDAVLNGNTYHEALKFDTPIRKIERYSLVLTKHREDTILGNGTGRAEITITGSYIRPGSELTIKAIASVDSDRFPVVFSARQEEDMIYGTIDVIGTDYLKVPDKFCFDITEITTCDDLYCGGAGLLLYRNYFNTKEFFGRIPYGNNFLNVKNCR